MAIQLANNSFTGFWDHDFDRLEGLDFPDRVRWLEYRFGLVLLDPVRLLVDNEHNSYVWFAVVQLICAGVEALSAYEFTAGTDTVRFEQFLRKYFDPSVWRDNDARLTTRPPVGGCSVTPAQALYKYFRNGLSHGLRIKWGTLLHREDGGPDYADVRDLNELKQQVLCVAPRALYDDFDRAVRRFFCELAVADATRRVIFMDRFDAIRREPWRD